MVNKLLMGRGLGLRIRTSQLSVIGQADMREHVATDLRG